MSLKDLIIKLDELEHKIHAYNHAMSVVVYDGATGAPVGSAAGRGEILGILAEAAHNIFINDDTDTLLRGLESHMDELDDLTARRVKKLRKEFDLESKIPTELLVEYSKVCSDADSVWHAAKTNNDFASFEPYIKKLVELKIKIAKCYDPDRDPYDTWLDQYEKGFTREVLDDYFAKIKTALVPLVKKIGENSHKVSDDILYGKFDIAKQKELSDYLMEVLGIDRNFCAIDETEHPFTDGFNKHDVRITTNYHEDSACNSMYSVIHEGGHAIYELNSGDALEYTCLAGGVSMGMHESQSRFFENIIGRSEEFITLVTPKLKELFPEQFGNVTARELYLAINKSNPSLIRIDADEVTYSLHVMVRYEIEKLLFDGKIDSKELPTVWNNMMKEYLGVEVPDDTHGVLQDSHWSGGMFGYFPSYSLGSAMGAQFLKAMEKELDVKKLVTENKIPVIVNWLTEHIYKFGCMYEPSELLEMCCGEKFDPSCYVDYLTAKFSAIYGFEA